MKRRAVFTNTPQLAPQTQRLDIKRSLLHIQMIGPMGVIKKRVSKKPGNLAPQLMSCGDDFIERDTC